MGTTDQLRSPRLAWWLHVAQIVGIISFGFTIAGSAVTAIVVTNTWFVTLDNRLERIQAEEKEEHDQIVELQAYTKMTTADLDRRINALAAASGKRDTDMEAEVQRLHADSDAADAEIRAKIAVLDERSKFTADRALQPPLPAPYRPAGR